VDLGDPVLDRCSLDFVFDLAVAKRAFEGDELALLESFREHRQVVPGIDAMPFGAGFVVALVVLPAFLGSDVEDNELAIVLSGFGFCVLAEVADEGDFVEHSVWLLFLVCPLSCGTVLPNGCAVATHSLGDWTESVAGDPSISNGPPLATLRVEFRRRPVMHIHTVGIDIAKTVFHLVALDEYGSVVVKKKCSRSQLLLHTANMKADVIGMEACSGAHFLARSLVAQGHEVKLMPAEYMCDLM
jgi:hypothetical protein